MKTTLTTAAGGLLATAAPAFAAQTTADGEIGLLGILFLGFGALIITFQLIPALMLFVGFVKGLFATTTRKATVAGEPE